MRFVTLMLSVVILSLAAVSGSVADISDARNFYQFDDRVLTSGQPDQTLLEKADEDGIEIVINLVPKTESIYNPMEADILQSQGIQYIHNPVNWNAPKESELKSFLFAMKKAEGKKVLIHCWSNARASALVYAYRVSKAPDTKAAEFERLQTVWKDVAGYDLATNQTWQKFLKQSVGSSQ